jgi:hypothetical protein
MDEMFRLRSWFKYSTELYECLDWIVEGQEGAINFWMKRMPAEVKDSPNDWYGGIEIHYRTPPDYMSGAPSHHDCPYTGSICWHDGSSLQAENNWIPLWSDWTDVPKILSMLECDYCQRFNVKEDG